MTKEELDKLVSQAETLELTDEERKKAKGSFVKLPCGNTHYELKGDGEPVVLVHGYATPYSLYEKIFEGLVANGYKVLRYDLLGRGLSERVDEVYSAVLFARQLYEITNEFFPDEQFNLFGTSMGGTITATFCALYPGRAKRVVWLAPAGMDTFKPPFYMKLSDIPGIGDLIFNAIASKTLLVKCASELYHCSEEDKDYFMREFAYSIKYKGFVKCTLSSLRNTILKTEKATKSYIETAKQKIPTLCVWGDIDKTMPFYQQARMREVVPHAEFVMFTGSGHNFVYDEGERTLEVVLPFLKK